MSSSEVGRKRKLIDDSSDETNAMVPASSAASPSPVHATSSSSSSSSSSSASTGMDEDLLRQYYDRLFPYDAFVTWLSPASLTQLPRREFSFTLAGDIYIRYQSLASKEELRSALLTRLPHKIDIGAVFNASPALHTSVSNFLPVSKELVFDLDMDDYKDVRTCCQDSRICERCWPFMSAAVRVIDSALRNDFGFHHLLWVYSGRRGVHCWVCDDRAKLLGNDGRTAVVDYLSLHRGGDSGKSGDKRSQLSMPLHPMLATALEQLKPAFEKLMIDQGWLEDPESRERFLSYVEENVRPELAFSDGASGPEKWSDFIKKVNQLIHRAATSRASAKVIQAHKTIEPRIILGHVFPRLDANVSKQLNHLLKAPFCVHPKTGRVCVPFEAANADSFDTSAVPTLQQLDAELKSRGGDSNKPIYEQTSLKPYIELFNAFAKGLQPKALEQSRRAQTRSLDW